MAAHASLKLVDPESTDPDVLRFERRRCPRHSTSGQVTAVQEAADPTTHTARICSLQLLNISDTGLGALTDDEIPCGTLIRVYFPSHGAEGGFELFGSVVRSVRRETGHEIGVRLGTKQAAA